MSTVPLIGSSYETIAHATDTESTRPLTNRRRVAVVHVGPEDVPWDEVVLREFTLYGPCSCDSGLIRQVC